MSKSPASSWQLEIVAARGPGPLEFGTARLRLYCGAAGDHTQRSFSAMPNDSKAANIAPPTTRCAQYSPNTLSCFCTGPSLLFHADRIDLRRDAGAGIRRSDGAQ